MALHLQRRSEPLRPLSWYKDLAGARGRRDQGFFLVEGFRAIGQIASVAPESIDEIVSDGTPLKLSLPCPVRILEHRQIASVVASETPQGVFAVVRIPEDSRSPQLPGNIGNRILLCEDIQDPGNIGTLIRTAAGFGFSGAVLSEKCADPFGPKAVQASAGAILSVWIRRSPDFLDLTDRIKKTGFTLTAADIRGNTDTSWSKAGKLAIALGNEGAGLSPELCKKADWLYRIPMHSNKIESLNVAVSGAVCMFLAAQ